MSKIVIQPDADTLEALFRSRGEEAWVEFTHAVVGEFARRHLKVLANSDRVKGMLDQIEKAIKESVQVELGTWKDGWAKKEWVPSPAFRAVVEQYIEQTARPALQKMLDELARPKLEAVAEEAVRAALERLPRMIDLRIETALRAEFQGRMDRALAAFKAQ